MANYFGVTNGRAGDASFFLRIYFSGPNPSAQSAYLQKTSVGLASSGGAVPTVGEIWPRGSKTAAG